MVLSLLGGAHEGLQHLGPYGNIPNIVAELTGDNIPKDFSEDQGYPDPPNPCPIGKTGKLHGLTTEFCVKFCKRSERHCSQQKDSKEDVKQRDVEGCIQPLS